MKERNMDWLPREQTPPGDRTCNPGMCPDWESNQRPFTLQDGAQPREPHWSGLYLLFEKTNKHILLYEKYLKLFLHHF